MAKITIDLPDELLTYLNQDEYIGNPSTFIACLIRRWIKELDKERHKLSSTQKQKFEESIWRLVKKLKTLKLKLTTFLRDDGTPVYEGFHISHFLIQLETQVSSEAEILKIFDLTILVDFSKDDFLKVLQAQIRYNKVEFEYLDKEHLSIEELEGIIQSVVDVTESPT